jgi:hypothetical protein
VVGVSLTFAGSKEVDLAELEAKLGIPILRLGRDRAGYASLEASEVKAILTVFDMGLYHLRKVAPKIAADIERQRQLALEFAAIAKAQMKAEDKRYSFPPDTSAGLGVAWLFPQAIKYAATPSNVAPCYTDYIANSWDIPINTDRAYWILGDGTNYYKCNPTEDQRSFILVFQNGIVEVGSTPAAEQFQVKSESRPDLGMYTVEPLIEVNTEDFKSLYQYPTPGALFVDHIKGVMWGFRPKRAGTATMKLLGLVYYEFNFVGAGFKWV